MRQSYIERQLVGAARLPSGGLPWGSPSPVVRLPSGGSPWGSPSPVGWRASCRMPSSGERTCASPQTSTQSWRCRSRPPGGAPVAAVPSGSRTPCSLLRVTLPSADGRRRRTAQPCPAGEQSQREPSM